MGFRLTYSVFSTVATTSPLRLVTSTANTGSCLSPPAVAGSVTANLPGDDRADIVNALLALGYNEKEALGAVKQLPDGVGVSDGIRQALKGLSKA